MAHRYSDLNRHQSPTGRRNASATRNIPVIPIQTALNQDGNDFQEKPSNQRRVISASKRTDIPAFYLPWFAERVREGHVIVRNPLFYRASHPERFSIRVSLRPEDVAAIVWWSKNYGVYLRPTFYRVFEIYERQRFQFTINPRGPVYAWLEPDVPDLDEALRQARELAARRGATAIRWRYDPIVFWRDGQTDRWSWDADFFQRMCEELAAIGVPTCITSIVDRYRKFEQRVRLFFPNIQLRDPSPVELDDLVGAMAEIAGQHSITLETCSEPLLERYPEFRRASCIDGHELGASAAKASDQRMKGRETCGCSRHTDIGDYERQECGYSCIYCYGTPNHRRFMTAARPSAESA